MHIALDGGGQLLLKAHQEIWTGGKHYEFNCMLESANFSMAATYDEKRINPCATEVNVSRADSLAEVARAEKRAGYARIAELIYYVVPQGMVEAFEVPRECGLVVELEPRAFAVVRRPKKRCVSLTVAAGRHGSLAEGKQ